jgi:hypothetical protein
MPKAKCTKQQFTTYFRYHLTEQDWTDVPLTAMPQRYSRRITQLNVALI